MSVRLVADDGNRLTVDDFGNAVGRPCRGCGGPRLGIIRGSSYCETCREARAILHYCDHCGREPRRRGGGSRLCVICSPKQKAPAPCALCGERNPKPKRGCRNCVSCQEWAHEVREAKLRARKTKARKPCDDCGRPRGDYRRHYCDACAARHVAERHLCSACGERPRRGPRKIYCVECYDYVLRRRRSRSSRRRLRSVPNKPARKRTNEQRIRGNENRRIAARLKAELEGREFNDAISRGRTRTFSRERWNYKRTVAGEPIAHALYEQAAGVGVEVYCNEVEVPSRSVRRWYYGEGIRLDTLDRILLAMDVTWQDVYDPQRFSALYTPLRWIDIVDTLSRAFEGQALIGLEAVEYEERIAA